MQIPLKRISIPLAALLAGTFFVAAPVAHAQPEPVKTAREAVIESIEKLETLQSDTTLGPAKKLERETALKREALTNIIELSVRETESIREKLEDVPVDTRFEALRKTYLAEIENHLEYFAATEKILASTVTLDGIQQIAGQLKDWRRVTYDPAVAKMIDLYLVFQNRVVMETARERLDRIGSDLKRKAPKTRSLWQPLVARAGTNINEAEDLNDRALELLTAYLPKPSLTSPKNALDDAKEVISAPDQEEKKIVPSTGMTAVAEPDSAAAPTIRNLVEDSFGEIKTAYKIFVELTGYTKR